MRLFTTFHVFGGGLLIALQSLCAVTAHGDHHHHVHGDLFASAHYYEDHGSRHRHCATPVPNLRDELVDQLRFREAFEHNDARRRKLQTSCDTICEQCIEIDVHLHLIQANVTDLGIIFPHPTRPVLRWLNGDDTISLDDFSSQDQILDLFRDNIVVANDAFVGTPFRFRFVPERTTVTISNDWSNDAVDYRQEMSQAVGSNDLRILDVFVAWNLQQREDGLVLGIAALPAAQIAGQGDGLVLRYDVLAGGGLTDNDYGYTFVHEIGHWLGLLHTFQTIVSDDDACSPDEQGLGDFVDDTPVQSGPSTGLAESCTEYLGNGEAPDTCPDLPGRDDIHNFMNYMDTELCLAREGRFSCGQIERMYRHWLLFRDHVALCEDPDDFELEVVVSMDDFYIADNRILLATADTETVLFDSLKDHYVAAVIFDTENLLFDLCLPRDQRYLLVIRDQAGDGFADGTIEIYIDRDLAGRVSGNFGDLQVIEISAEGATIETLAPTQPREPTAAPTLAPTPTPTSTPTPDQTEKPTTTRIRATLPPILNDQPTDNPVGVTLPPILIRPQDLPTTVPTQGPSSDIDSVDTSGTTAVSVSLAFGVVALLFAWL